MINHAAALLYNGLNSVELEALPEAVLIHHATPYESDSGGPLRGVVRPLRLVSMCDPGVDVVTPQRFDPADPYACVQCLAVVLAGQARTKGHPS